MITIPNMLDSGDSAQPTLEQELARRDLEVYEFVNSLLPNFQQIIQTESLSSDPLRIEEFCGGISEAVKEFILKGNYSFYDVRRRLNEQNVDDMNDLEGMFPNVNFDVPTDEVEILISTLTNSFALSEGFEFDVGEYMDTKLRDISPMFAVINELEFQLNICKEEYSLDGTDLIVEAIKQARENLEEEERIESLQLLLEVSKLIFKEK